MTATINASTSAGVVTTADTSGILQLQTNGTAALTVDASQNVGIGITSPTRKLAVSGTWTNTGDYLMDSGSPQLAWTSGDLRFKTGGLSGTEVVRIDSSGNVGIGVTPQTWTVYKPLSIAGVGQNVAASGGAGELQLTANCYYNGGWKYATTQKTGRFAVGEGYNDFKWFQAASGTADTAVSFTQAMTLDSSGNLLVNTTTAIGTITTRNTGNYTIGSVRTGTGGEGHISFRNANGEVGYIQTSGSSTSYVTSSDYRLKNTITPMTGALAKVVALKPCTYKWNVDGSDGQGFIAHELAEVVEGCVTGAKDAVDADGNPQYQGIDTSFLVATLTAAIKELKAIVDAQGAEIAALKGATA